MHLNTSKRLTAQGVLFTVWVYSIYSGACTATNTA